MVALKGLNEVMPEMYTAKCLAWSKYSRNICYHHIREQRDLMEVEKEGLGQFSLHPG